MSNSDRLRWEQYRDALKRQESITKARGLESNAAAKKEYECFLEHITRNACYICGKPLKTFSSGFPCVHWLLRPKGVKKDHVYSVLSRDGYHRSAAFLRWHSNYQGFSRNINDLKEESDQSALFHWSCTYEHRHWTFKCGRTDYEGHAGTKADFPHYHVQMRLADQVFVKFNDFHVPFTDEDLFWLRANLDPQSPIRQSFGPHGSGMEDAMGVDADVILSNTVRANEEEIEQAVFRIDTFVYHPEGISADTIQGAIEAANKSGKTIAYHLKEMGLSSEITISPAETIPDNPNRNRTR